MTRTEFLKAQWEVLAAADFFTVDFWMLVHVIRCYSSDENV